MYSRNYAEEKKRIVIPQGYEGTALIQQSDSTDEYPCEENEAQTPSEKVEKEEAKEASSSSVFASLPILDKLGGLFKGGKFGLKSIGFEELLIGGVALYLLFSQNSDVECAIMLIILLFIT